MFRVWLDAGSAAAPAAVISSSRFRSASGQIDRLVELQRKRICFLGVGILGEQFVEHPFGLIGLPSLASDLHVEHETVPLAQPVCIVQRHLEVLLALRLASEVAAHVRKMEIGLGKRRIDGNSRLEQFFGVGHPDVRRRLDGFGIQTVRLE